MPTPGRTAQPPDLHVEAHELITGTTGSGKTHYALHVGRTWPGSVVFWNPQADDLAAGWIQADRQNAPVDLFRRRHCISYVPHWDAEKAIQEAGVLVRYLMRPDRVSRWRPPVLLIWDEADLLARQGTHATPLHEVAQRGRKRGVFGRFVTQFPADLDKTIVRNCRAQTYFVNPYAIGYYKAQGLPGEEIISKLQAAPEHSFMRWQDGIISGPYRL